MLYLIDANTVIDAKDLYFAIDQVPEYWEWLIHQGQLGNVKMPTETFEEVSPGRDKDDPFYKWRKDKSTAEALLLEEEVDYAAVQRVLAEGYAPDLNDNEIDQIGRDPFLIAYALDNPARTIVTTEVSKPTLTRQNRRVPDVCGYFGVPCINTFQMNRALGWRTSWKAR